MLANCNYNAGITRSILPALARTLGKIDNDKIQAQPSALTAQHNPHTPNIHIVVVIVVAIVVALFTGPLLCLYCAY